MNATMDAPPDNRALFNRLETLGNNCELGIVQAAAGSTTPSLFRNAGFNHTQQLIGALDNGLDGLFDPGSFTVNRIDGWPDLALNCRRYGFMFHTGLPADRPCAEADLAARVAAFRFMKMKLLDDLRVGEKLFVYRHGSEFDPDLAARLLRAIRRLGPGWLLYAREDRRPEARFGWVRHSGIDGLLHAGFPRLSNENPPTIAFPAWEKIARAALALRDGAEADRRAPAPPAPPPGVANVLTHGPAAADPFFSLGFDVTPGTRWTAQVWLWIPAAFPGTHLELIMLGYVSETWKGIDMACRDAWQHVWVTARVPPSQTRLVPALRTAQGGTAEEVRGVVFTAGWSVTRAD